MSDELTEERDEQARREEHAPDELDMRGRLVDLEEKHNRLVSSVRFTLIAVMALCLVTSILILGRAKELRQ